jgi:hypothetical protein
MDTAVETAACEMWDEFEQELADARTRNVALMKGP